MPGQFYADFGGKGYLKNGVLKKKNIGTPWLQSQECRYTRFPALFAVPVEEIQHEAARDKYPHFGAINQS